MDWRTRLKTLEDWVEKAIRSNMGKGGATVPQIIEYIDWQDRARYTEKEINESLDLLATAGKVC